MGRGSANLNEEFKSGGKSVPPSGWNIYEFTGELKYYDYEGNKTMKLITTYINDSSAEVEIPIGVTDDGKDNKALDKLVYILDATGVGQILKNQNPQLKAIVDKPVNDGGGWPDKLLAGWNDKGEPIENGKFHTDVANQLFGRKIKLNVSIGKGKQMKDKETGELLYEDDGSPKLWVKATVKGMLPVEGEAGSTGVDDSVDDFS